MLLGWFLRAVGPRRVLGELARADPAPVVVGVCAGCSAVLLWSEALRVALGVLGREAGGLRFRLAFLSGDFAKQVLPFGHVSGPAIMAYAVAEGVGSAYEETLAAVTVADLLNLVASLTLAAGGLALVGAAGTPVPGLAVFTAALVVALLGVATVGLLVTVSRPTLSRVVQAAAALTRATAGRLDARVDSRLAEAAVTGRLEGYYRTFDAVTADRRRVAVAVALAVGGWLLVGSALYCSALALDVRVSPALALALAPLSGLATWLPVPGGVGGVEVAVAGGLAAAGVDLGVATAVALCYRLCSYWAVVALDGSAVVAFSLATGRDE